MTLMSPLRRRMIEDMTVRIFRRSTRSTLQDIWNKPRALTCKRPVLVCAQLPSLSSIRLPTLRNWCLLCLASPRIVARRTQHSLSQTIFAYNLRGSCLRRPLQSSIHSASMVECTITSTAWPAA
jgi:hypothetical protein